MSVSDKYLKKRDFNQKVRVMIVDDSVVVRGMFTKWLENVPNIEIVAVHRNGKIAVDNIANDKPDVVLLDIEMPEMDGLTALPLMLKNYPEAKIIISSTLTTRNADISLKAMSLGAIDYVAKPSGVGGLTTTVGFKDELIQKVKVFGGVASPTNPHGGGFRATSAQRSASAGSAARSRAHETKASAPTPSPASASVPRAAASRLQASSAAEPKTSFAKGQKHPISKTVPKVIVIGSSTGGPPALLELTKTITKDVGHLPVFITQHMPPSFTSILAVHIAKATGRVCKEGEDGEAVKNGVIYIAPGGKHMSIAGSAFNAKIKLDDGPQINYCKPSVDPLFETAANIYKKAVLSIILTGMGNDGTPGAGKVIEHGGSVIVQDEASSVVWGMPGSAVQEGVISEILPLKEIGNRVVGIVRGKV